MTEWTKERQVEIREWVRDKSDFTWDAAKEMLDEIERLQARVEVQEESNIAMGEAYSSQLSTLTRERDEARAQAETLFHQPVAQQNIDLQEQLALADKLAEALGKIQRAGHCVGRALPHQAHVIPTGEGYCTECGLGLVEAWEQGRGK